MTCIKCGTELLTTQPLELSGEFRGETLTVTMDAQLCPGCGYKRITGQQMDQFARKVADAYQRKGG